MKDLVLIITIMVTTAMGYRMEPPTMVLPLNMAPNSVDDAYTSCTNKMSGEINKCLDKDCNSWEVFKKAWEISKARVKAKNESGNLPNILTENQAIAIQVYTRGDVNIYKEFNEAVRDGKNTYTTTFKYRALHFLLTDALKQLKDTQEDYFTVYRRTNLEFKTNVLNKEIRFGSFASSSLKLTLHSFGEKSCFKIITRHGAALGNYSNVPHEDEVLIPPYEKFQVVRVEKKIEIKDLWCNVVYTLISTGTSSNLDCVHVCC